MGTRLATLPGKDVDHAKEFYRRVARVPVFGTRVLGGILRRFGCMGILIARVRRSSSLPMSCRRLRKKTVPFARIWVKCRARHSAQGRRGRVAHPCGVGLCKGGSWVESRGRSNGWRREQGKWPQVRKDLPPFRGWGRVEKKVDGAK